MTKTKVAANDKSFASLGLIEGNTLTLSGTRALDLEEQKMYVSGAYYVSHVQDLDPELFTITVDTENPDEDGTYTAKVVPVNNEFYYFSDAITDVDLNYLVELGEIEEATIEAYADRNVKSAQGWIDQAENLGMTPEEIVEYLLSDDGNIGVYEMPGVEAKIGKNYVFAYTFSLDAENKVSAKGLTINMYMEKTNTPQNPDLMTFGLEVEPKIKDVIVNIDAPDTYVDEDGYPMNYIFRWAEAYETIGLTDEELFAANLEAIKQESDYYNQSLSTTLSTWAIISGDKEEFSALSLVYPNIYIDCPVFKPETSYEFYIYAVDINEDGTELSLASNITRVVTSTLPIEKVAMEFTYGYDRITMAEQYEVLTPTAYPMVSAEPVDQNFTFITFKQWELDEYGMETLTPEFAEYNIKTYIDRMKWEPELVWYSQGTLIADQYDGGIPIWAGKDNRFYIVACAINEDFEICSDIVIKEMDPSNEEVTDAQMNLTVSNNEGTYTATVSPVKADNGYVFKAVTITEMKTFLTEYSFDAQSMTDKEVVEKYGEYIVSITLNEYEGTMQEKVSEYLQTEGTTETSLTVTPTEVTYAIAYSVYANCGIINGFAYELLGEEAPAAEMTVNSITVSEQSGMPNMFNLSFLDGSGVEISKARIQNVNAEELNVAIGVEYTVGGEAYKIIPGGTDKVPNNEYSSDAAEGSTLIITGEAGNYTLVADILYENGLHYKYTYTGPITGYGFPEESTDEPAEMSFQLSVRLGTEGDGKLQGYYIGKVTPSDVTRAYYAGFISQAELESSYSDLSAATPKAWAEEFFIPYLVSALENDEMEVNQANVNELLIASEQGMSGVKELPAYMTANGINYFISFAIKVTDGAVKSEGFTVEEFTK